MFEKAGTLLVGQFHGNPSNEPIGLVADYVVLTGGIITLTLRVNVAIGFTNLQLRFANMS